MASCPCCNWLIFFKTCLFCFHRHLFCLLSIDFNLLIIAHFFNVVIKLIYISICTLTAWNAVELMPCLALSLPFSTVDDMISLHMQQPVYIPSMPSTVTHKHTQSSSCVKLCSSYIVRCVCCHTNLTKCLNAFGILFIMPIEHSVRWCTFLFMDQHIGKHCSCVSCLTP